MVEYFIWPHGESNPDSVRERDVSEPLDDEATNNNKHLTIDNKQRTTNKMHDNDIFTPLQGSTKQYAVDEFKDYTIK